MPCFENNCQKFQSSTAQKVATMIEKLFWEFCGKFTSRALLKAPTDFVADVYKISTFLPFFTPQA